MRILIACEYSGIVRDAFSAKNIGHDVWSCDLLPTEKESGFVPDRHFTCDVFSVLDLEWDLMIAFPPCTNLCVSGARWFASKRATGEQQASIEFFMKLAKQQIPKIAIENPVGIMSSHFRKPDQIIQPWQFGHGETKATCLWLKNLPKLTPTNIVEGREQRVWKMAPGPNRWKERSRTFTGIASAMADQWSNF